VLEAIKYYRDSDEIWCTWYKYWKISDSILSILRLHLDKYRLLAQGIVERDKDLIIQAIALDPFTPSPKEAERIFDIFIKSSEKFLPIKFN